MQRIVCKAGGQPSDSTKLLNKEQCFKLTVCQPVPNF